MSCTWGSDGPVKRARSEERYDIGRALHGKGPFGSRESTRPTSDGVSFRDANDIGVSGRSPKSENGRIEGVSISRDEMSKPC